MFEFLRKSEVFKGFFRREASGVTARERLRLVLLSDHLSLAPDVVDALKAELLNVISRYVDIDPAHAEVSFEHRDRELAMLASVPILAVRKDRPSAPPPSAVNRPPNGRSTAGTSRRKRRKRVVAGAPATPAPAPNGLSLNGGSVPQA
jgi:cell division topological specificity factor